MATIAFDPGTDTYYSVFAGIAEREFAVTLTYNEGIVGFPHHCMVVEANDEGIKVCEQDDDGAPIRNSLFNIGYDEIDVLTVL